MDLLWSASTTMRNPERTFSFLSTAAELENEVWNEETQIKYQILLIKNRFYKPNHNNLSNEQIAILEDYSHEMSFSEAKSIFLSKKYVDPDMRGRTSFDPLEKMGLVSLDSDDINQLRVKITGLGRLFLEGKIDLGEMVFISLLKIQFPNPLSSGRIDYNIKPFIGILHLIKQVNEIWEKLGEKSVGISREEFGIFGLSLKDYRLIPKVAEQLVAFRKSKRNLHSELERNIYVKNFISDYLSTYKNAEKNCREYTDNMIRYLRLTKYIYIRGGGYYIDLEPRRMVEIDAILNSDVGSAEDFTLEEYITYISDYRAYKLPFESTTKLRDIASGLIDDIHELSLQLGGEEDFEIIISGDINELKTQIESLRFKRLELQNKLLKLSYQDTEKIDEVINKLETILNNKKMLMNRPSIELEKWVNIALNVLNDALRIKPNAPMGDDFEPTFTAPANVPDIECYYDGFAAICEVTMLTGRDQWFNEGQPVMRHLRSFENNNSNQENYCLFVAPRLHPDTINTFWNSIKYEFEGSKQKIIPITIDKLIELLIVVRRIKEQGKKFSKEDLRSLYEKCVDISNISKSTLWIQHILKSIENWRSELTGA